MEPCLLFATHEVPPHAPPPTCHCEPVTDVTGVAIRLPFTAPPIHAVCSVIPTSGFLAHHVINTSADRSWAGFLFSAGATATERYTVPTPPLPQQGGKIARKRAALGKTFAIRLEK